MDISATPLWPPGGVVDPISSCKEVLNIMDDTPRMEVIVDRIDDCQKVSNIADVVVGTEVNVGKVDDCQKVLDNVDSAMETNVTVKDEGSEIVQESSVVCESENQVQSNIAHENREQDVSSVVDNLAQLTIDSSDEKTPVYSGEEDTIINHVISLEDLPPSDVTCLQVSTNCAFLLSDGPASLASHMDESLTTSGGLDSLTTSVPASCDSSLVSYPGLVTASSSFENVRFECADELKLSLGEEEKVDDRSKETRKHKEVKHVEGKSHKNDKNAASRKSATLKPAVGDSRRSSRSGSDRSSTPMGSPRDLVEKPKKVTNCKMSSALTNSRSNSSTRTPRTLSSNKKTNAPASKTAVQPHTSSSEVSKKRKGVGNHI